ncbi:MAG: hypothetical protein A3J76_00975 [Candidatus Moranbacteria bacterium RBG_13_45_13]|nr:MAG: hypothetical protein A3J76_00975 [Candidatus Moranbacteria bacterium RBG_13_45_13]
MKKYILMGGVLLFAFAMSISMASAANINWQLVQTLNIPANTTTPTASMALLNGMQYKVSVEGTYLAGDNIQADAEYSFRTGSSTEWTDSVSTYETYGEELLDLYMDSDNDWGDYSTMHKYSKEITGAGNPLNFHIYDTYPSNNTGVLVVKIYSARYAEITAPNENSVNFGNVNLGAYLVDDDQDPVNWAVRRGTCAMATNNIIGNVDGMHDDYSWVNDSATYTQTFGATADTTSWLPGKYCFVFNPSEDGGESDIRLTREFYVITGKDDCKKDGWKTNFDSIFKNQGDCVSFVATNGKNLPANQ